MEYALSGGFGLHLSLLTENKNAGESTMNKLLAVVVFGMIAHCAFAASVDAMTQDVSVVVTSLSVRQRYPWNGKVDIDSLEAIAFDPYTHGYYKVGGRVGEAFRDGLKLK